MHGKPSQQRCDPATDQRRFDFIVYRAGCHGSIESGPKSVMLPLHFRDLARQTWGMGGDGCKQPVFMFDFADVGVESFPQFEEGRLHVGAPGRGSGRTGDPGLEPRHCLSEVDAALARCFQTSIACKGSLCPFRGDASGVGVGAHMATLLGSVGDHQSLLALSRARVRSGLLALVATRSFGA